MSGAVLISFWDCYFCVQFVIVESQTVLLHDVGNLKELFRSNQHLFDFRDSSDPNRISLGVNAINAIRTHELCVYEAICRCRNESMNGTREV